MIIRVDHVAIAVRELDKARDLIDNLGTTDFESYLTDDDPEMAVTTVQGAAQEVQRALAEMNILTGNAQAAAGMLERGMNMITLAREEIDRYIASEPNMRQPNDSA